MTVRTSATHPIRVDWLPITTKGKLGLTIAPGKSGSSMEGAPWKRSISADFERLAMHHTTTTLVCLLEDHEFERLGIAEYEEYAQAASFDIVRLPIVDGGTPSSNEAFTELVKSIPDKCEAGTNVVIHCAAGLGRSGIVGGAVLIAEGKSATEAIDILHRVRSPRSPENRKQEQFLELFETRERAARAEVAKVFGSAPSRQGRRVGAVLGAAIGDAIGHPTEFMKLSAIRKKWGASGVQGFELYWERDGKRFAPYTDDTQMAEIVLRVLIDAKLAKHDLDTTMTQMAKDFVQWDKHPQGGHRAPANACRAGCAELAKGVHWSLAGGEQAGGCGTVMRAYPFGLVYADDLERAERWAVEHSKLTHRDPIALAGSAAMAIGTALAFNLAAPEVVVAGMIAVARRYSVKTADMMQLALDEALAGVGPEVTLARLEAWAAHEAIAAGVYIFARHPNDPRAAILEGANTDGDSDTIATVAGALVGARCGVDALPHEWVVDLERSEELAALARRV